MNKRNFVKGTGIGVGYVSVMIIFAVICLTIFAVLSYCAASSGDKLNARSGEFTREYYAADCEAKEVLAELDEAALGAAEAFSFEEAFSEAASELGDFTAVKTQGGVSVSYCVEINERQELAVGLTFFSEPELHDNCRYEINEWKFRIKSDSDDSDEHLGVWNGEMF
jgi:hypothetical protein